METNRTEHLATSVMTDATEPAATAATKKDFVEPELSEPVDILEATRFFLQVTGGGDV